MFRETVVLVASAELVAKLTGCLRKTLKSPSEYGANTGQKDVVAKYTPTSRPTAKLFNANGLRVWAKTLIDRTE